MVDRRPNIWKLQANQDTDGLVRALSYSDPDIRKRAAAALRVLGAMEAVEPLQAALKNERQPDVREHLTAALEHLDASFSKQAVKEKTRDDLIQTLLSSTDEEILIKTAAKLGETGDQLATESLVTVFRDPMRSDKVRLAAAKALLTLKSAPSVVTLLAGLKKDNWRIRHNAAAVLGQLKATWATQALVEALADPHPNVRLAAAAALHRFQTREAMKALALYQKRRSGQTKPLPRRPEVDRHAASKSTPPPPKNSGGTTSTATTPKSSTSSNAASPKPSSTPKKLTPPKPVVDTKPQTTPGKRDTQQIKPQMPATPKVMDDKSAGTHPTKPPESPKPD